MAPAVFAHPRPSTLVRSAFLARFGGIYEHATWVAETVFDAGLTVADDFVERLAERMREIVDAADEQQRLALLRAHPELAGKLAMAGKLTKESASEQFSAGLDRCTEDEFRRFQALNSAYRQLFGFPFIIAVRGLSRQQILGAFEERVGNARETELRTAMEQVHRIARLRLEALE
jgi:OHCU decarboxylase